MSNDKIIIDFSKIIRDITGEIIKDMLDPPLDRTIENAPDLTLGSVFAHALTIGIRDVSIKEALKIFRMAQKIESALQMNQGKSEFSESDLNQLEEALAKIKHPLFTMPLYAGPMAEAIEEAKIELLAKRKSS